MLLYSILLASSVLFNTAYGKEVIGYRIVSPDEAEGINDNNKPFDYKAYDDDSLSPQLGRGFYMTNVPDSQLALSDEWYCVIKADSDKIGKADKVWIPKIFEDEERSVELWTGNEDAILEYIKSLVSDDAEEALRFSYIVGAGEKLQMVIPPEAIDEDDLGLWAQCWATEEEQMRHSSEIVPWTTWNIVGNLGPSDPDEMETETGW
ncbi:uncharacterized protein L3040_001123 [Drepanopeziza brunnea f. sp. 'multigermtubi']|uniref:Uncharacterized protein n=1 Tax=Marssonina brunnea f. sp. multigermtubi (strain MB_m1) TaxID=1072389 RepID=K1WGY4_MARBU|nr:uncharacterized protein MBM_05309 [Drepanopeziza brunnea f. sp. 'multigermtubi' MB_m1]EKD16840.1 hypothetical protein MBM_05309 [Drepanopeziza brunnea f. sp. 'multigermtubi' MB_m1]KAJ5054861.1 hypothetical protein L3040_001123 [Drepanopeziza brunnea f. sp. 'multigermtubi']